MFWESFWHNIQFIIWTVLGQIGIRPGPRCLDDLPHAEREELPSYRPVFPRRPLRRGGGVLWRIIYNKDYGLLNLFLMVIGKPQWIKPWLDDPAIVIPSWAIPKIWQYIATIW
jgi:raffinose/stachyose/melibiose transport system permease protein